MSDGVTANEAVPQKEEGSAPAVQANEAPVESKKDSVQYETYQRTVSEAKKAKAKAAELEALVAKFQEEENARAEAKLLEEKNFNQVLENRDQTIAQLKEELGGMKGTITTALKRDAFLQNLEGKLEERYYGLIPYDEIPMDPATMQVDQMSLASVIEKFSKEHHRLIDPVSAPKLPADKPQGTAQSTLDGKKDLSSEERRLEVAKAFVQSRA